MIALGSNPTPNLHISATIPIPFALAFLLVSYIIFAYGGHIYFFSFISELPQTARLPKALFLFQITKTYFYILVFVVVYRYTRENVASPASKITGHVIQKIAYEIAVPAVSLSPKPSDLDS
jgi:amino acid permease